MRKYQLKGAVRTSFVRRILSHSTDLYNRAGAIKEALTSIPCYVYNLVVSYFFVSVPTIIIITKKPFSLFILFDGIDPIRSFPEALMQLLV